MITGYFTLIFRQFRKNQITTSINLIGLIAGLTVSLCIYQYVTFEFSFERFNNNADRTYRINLYNTSDGVLEGISTETVSGLAFNMEQAIPEIDLVGRIASRENAVVQNPENQKRFLEDNIAFADAEIIDLLAIKLLSGNKTNILKDAQSVVLSQTMALKYFGSTNVLGKILLIGFPGANIELRQYSIQGVFQDLPVNTNEHFDMLLSNPNGQQWDENWAWSNVTTYTRLNDPSSITKVEQGLSQIVMQHHKDGKGDKYLLEPIQSIRLYAFDGSGRGTLVNLFIILGFVILLLAWLNYISLTTATYLESMKEIGIRKILGASRTQLIIRFFCQSIIFNLISVAVAIGLFIIIWPIAATYFSLPPSVSLGEVRIVQLIFATVIIFGILLSGFYPAFFLSSFHPLHSVKNNLWKLGDGSALRKSLVVIQLCISLILISSVLAIRKQINFISNQNLGIDLKQTLIIDAPLLTDATTVAHYEPFRNEISELASVTGVTYASSFPGSEIEWHRADITLNEENDGHRYSSRIVSIGTEFLDVFDLPVLAGRNFLHDKENDKKALLINEKASEMFGFNNISEAIGKVVFIGSRRFDIIGVIRNYHFRSLQHGLQPILFMQGYPRNPGYAIKVASVDVMNTVTQIKRKWESTYPGNIFNYYFLDEKFEQQYNSEKQNATIIGALTLLAVIISFLGLFALSLHSANRRIKEVGIRKAFGASAVNVILLLSTDFAKLVLAACVFGVPLSYFLVDSWLTSYAYRMPIDISLFLVPVGIITILTAATVSIKTLQCANTNPATSLRNE